MTHAMPPPFSEHPLPAWRRAVLKVGSSLLAAEGEGLSPRHALNLAQFVSSSIAAGREVVIVSSGAVAAGGIAVQPSRCFQFQRGFGVEQHRVQTE